MTRIDRRGFLRFGVATAGVACLSRFVHSADKDDGFGGFIVGAQSYTFRNFDLEPALKRMQECGLRHVEFYQKHAPLTDDAKKVAALKKICADYGISVVAWGVQGFSKKMDANKRIFEFGKALGVKSFSADPDPDSFDALDKLCDEYKIAIAIHPHGPSGKNSRHRWYGSEVILPAVKDHHPLIGTCLDTGHLIRMAQLGVKLDPAAEVRAMGSRNFGIHLKDHDNARKTDVICGKGVLNVVELLKALRDVKFGGHISIEYEANPAEPTADVKACVAAVKDAVKQLG
jgi:sugar phosphate isomerase/epimerase